MTDVTAVPIDTSRSAHEVQRDAYIRMGGAGRVAVMFRLTDTVRRLAMAGIRARHPEYDEDRVLRAYARLVLGDTLVRTEAAAETSAAANIQAPDIALAHSSVLEHDGVPVGERRRDRPGRDRHGKTATAYSPTMSPVSEGLTFCCARAPSTHSPPM